jgi:predicted nucleotidyltransferase
VTPTLADHIAARGARLLFACRVGEAVDGTVAAPNAPAPAGVRYIYVRSAEWYLTLAEGADSLDGPDTGTWGWDLRKVLRLLLRSNPMVWSWLSSPDVIHDPEGLGDDLRRLAHEGYSRRALGHALWGEARKALTAFLDRGEAMTATKSLKAARALLALRWLEGRATLPPLALDALLDQDAMPADVRAEIDAIRAAPVDRHPALYRWINDELDTAAERCAALPEGAPDPVAADALYRTRVIGNNAATGFGAGPDQNPSQRHHASPEGDPSA